MTQVWIKVESWMWRNLRWYRRARIKKCAVWVVRP